MDTYAGRQYIRIILNARDHKPKKFWSTIQKLISSQSILLIVHL